MKMKTSLKIAISSCLTGERVRYDGRHKRNETIIDALASVAALIPICPEIAVGMGVPRPPLALVEDRSGDLRMVTCEGEMQDFTCQMEKFAVETRVESLTGISGYIFKSRSPSCGIGDVPVLNECGDTVRDDSFGLYAGEIHRMMPNLPITDETRLATLADIHHFVERVSVYRVWLDSEIRTDEELREFHRQVRAHATARIGTLSTELDQLADGALGEDSTLRVGRYICALMSGLEMPPTDSGHAEALRAEFERTLPSASEDARSASAAILRDFENGTIDRNKLHQSLRRIVSEEASLSSYLSSTLWGVPGV